MRASVILGVVAQIPATRAGSRTEAGRRPSASPGPGSGGSLLSTLGASPQGRIQRLLALRDRSAHQDGEEWREQPVNVLDMGNRGAATGDGMDRNLPVPFEEPRLHHVTPPGQ